MDNATRNARGDMVKKWTTLALLNRTRQAMITCVN